MRSFLFDDDEEDCPFDTGFGRISFGAPSFLSGTEPFRRLDEFAGMMNLLFVAGCRVDE